MQSNLDDPVKRAWIQLALINKRNSTNTPQLVRELLAWREQNPNHPANQLLPDNSTLDRLLTMPPPSKIAVLLPLQGSYGSSGQAVREGFLNAYYKNMSKVGKQTVKFYDTSTTQDIAALHQHAMLEGADFVVGPLTKSNVQQLSQTGPFTYPILALNYTDTRSLPANFYEYGLLPEDEVTQVADRARQRGLSRAIIIAPQSAWGNRLVTAFSNRWQAAGGKIQQTWYYTKQTNFNAEIAGLLNVNPNADKDLMKTNNDKTVLEQQRRQDFDVIFLFAQPQEARTIVPLLRYYYANNVPIYATSAVQSSTHANNDVDLNGVTVCDIPNAGGGNDGMSSNRLYAVGQDAYLLSQALERLIMLPNFSIYGTTGALTLSPSHQIHRRLPCTTIQNGAM
jgi:hypothetical protein